MLSYVAVDKAVLNHCNDILDEYGQEDFDRHWRELKDIAYPEEAPRKEYAL